MQTQTSRRRYRTLIGLCLGALLVILILAFLSQMGSAVVVGMSEQQVEEIMGGPGFRISPEDGKNLNGVAKSLNIDVPPGSTVTHMIDWRGFYTGTIVFFDSDGKVVGVWRSRSVNHLINRLLRSVGLD